MVLRHGCVVAEGWWSPYGPRHPHMLYSLSKSFTSSAVGLAVAEGRLSVDDLLLSFFPDEAPLHPDPNLAKMRIRHLLSMSTGHAEDTTGRLHATPDGQWIKAFLALPVEYAPGTHFVYNSGASYMLSAVVQKLTGMTLIDYLTPRLFGPLGIQNPTWETSAEGINFGGWGLNIKTEDIARFGQMYLQKGVCAGTTHPERRLDRTGHLKAGIRTAQSPTATGNRATVSSSGAAGTRLTVGMALMASTVW